MAQSFFFPIVLKDAVTHDGDTVTHVHVDLGAMEGPDRDLGFNLHVVSGRLLLTKQSLRLIGIDTPEMKPGDIDHEGKKRSKSSMDREAALAVKARDFLVKRLSESTGHQLESVEKPDKFGRILSRLHVDGPSGTRSCLNDEMVTNGYARAYDGGHKTDW